MQPNVGGIDRFLRITIGALLFTVTTTSTAIGLWGLLGAIPLITGFMRYCPLYAVVRFSTCKSATA